MVEASVQVAKTRGLRSPRVVDYRISQSSLTKSRCVAVLLTELVGHDLGLAPKSVTERFAPFSHLCSDVQTKRWVANRHCHQQRELWK